MKFKKLTPCTEKEKLSSLREVFNLLLAFYTRASLRFSKAPCDISLYFVVNDSLSILLS